MEPEASPGVLIQSRRAARESALQALYQVASGGTGFEYALRDALARTNFTPSCVELVTELVVGVAKTWNQLDEQIRPFLGEGWTWDRIPAVDRCILRIAAYELYHIPTMPPKVTINEAVILAKKFDTPEAAKFINGLLGNLLKQSPKAEWDPNQHAVADEDRVSEPQLDEPIEEELVEEGSAQHEEMVKAGAWSIRPTNSPTA